jgi:dTMP kinase
VGKSTLIRAVQKQLVQKGLKVHLTKEVTSTPIGEFIHKHHVEYNGETLALLLAADRRNHIDSDILPALERHDVVITDRYISSSLVFQKLDGVGLPFLWKINGEFIKPHLSIIILASENIINSRMATRSKFDRFEKSFTRAEEIQLFAEAASSMKRRGFKTYIFVNEGVDIKFAANKLSDEILRVKRQAGNPRR